MPRRRSWFRVAKKKLFRSSSSSSSISRSPSSRAIILHYNTSGSFTSVANSTPRSKIVPFFSREELAAIKIQACFKAHLAKRAFRALRSLVKLQAVVRGVLVRRQARIALQCMYALARIQLTVRARQLLIIG